MPNPTPGRHRAPGAPSPVSALSSAVSRSAKPIGKVSAALAVSGGLVASFSLPASASPLSKQAKPAVAPAAAAPAAATPALDAVAVSTAASSRAAVVSPTFGEIGFTGVVKPKPKPKAKPKPSAGAGRPGRVGRQRRARRRPAEPLHAPQPPGRYEPPRHQASSHRAPSAPAPQRRHVAAPAPQAPRLPRSSGVLGIAAGLAGIPYVYGGTTPSGFDCSGYTQWVFARSAGACPHRRGPARGGHPGVQPAAG